MSVDGRPSGQDLGSGRCIAYYEFTRGLVACFDVPGADKVRRTDGDLAERCCALLCIAVLLAPFFAALAISRLGPDPPFPLLASATKSKVHFSSGCPFISVLGRSFTATLCLSWLPGEG